MTELTLTFTQSTILRAILFDKQDEYEAILKKLLTIVEDNAKYPDLDAEIYIVHDALQVVKQLLRQLG